MGADVAKTDHVANERDYLDEDELNEVGPAMLAASRGLTGELGRRCCRWFFVTGRSWDGGPFEPRIVIYYAVREAMFMAKQAELGKGVLNKGSR